MKKVYLIIVLAVLVVACKKKTEIYFREFYAKNIYRVEPKCDTAHIDSIYYQDENLNRVTVYNPSLPWEKEVKYDGQDTVEFAVFGLMGSKWSGSMDIEVIYDIELTEPGVSIGSSGRKLGNLHVYRDTVHFVKSIVVPISF